MQIPGKPSAPGDLMNDGSFYKYTLFVLVTADITSQDAVKRRFNVQRTIAQTPFKDTSFHYGTNICADDMYIYIRPKITFL